MKNKWLISFEDFQSLVLQSGRFAVKDAMQDADFKFFYEVYAYCEKTIPSSIAYLDSDTYVRNLVEVIAYRFYKSIIIVNEQEELTEEQVLEWTEKWIQWIMHTYDRYTELLKAYQANANNILAGASVSSVNKFNDVPQDVINNLASDNYLTTISRSDVENKESVLNQLNELRTKYWDVLDAWADEFNERFVIIAY